MICFYDRVRLNLNWFWRTAIFCGFPGYRPVLLGWFKIVCWFYVENTKRLTESGFMEKPGIEPATYPLHHDTFYRF